jgi:hypothetical protein
VSEATVMWKRCGLPCKVLATSPGNWFAAKASARQKQPRRLAEEGYGTCDASYRTAGHAVSLQHSRSYTLGDLRRNNSPDDDCLCANNSWVGNLRLAGYDSCTTLLPRFAAPIRHRHAMPTSKVEFADHLRDLWFSRFSSLLVRSVAFAIRELFPRTRHSSYQSKVVGGPSLQFYCTTSGSRVRRDRPFAAVTQLHGRCSSPNAYLRARTRRCGKQRR